VRCARSHAGHLPDLVPVLAEFARVLRPGGHAYRDTDVIIWQFSSLGRAPQQVDLEPGTTAVSCRSGEAVLLMMLVWLVEVGCQILPGAGSSHPGAPALRPVEPFRPVRKGPPAGL
jgi:hypothetical protein